MVLMYRGHFLPIAYWKQLWAKPVIDWGGNAESPRLLSAFISGRDVIKSRKSPILTPHVVKSNKPLLSEQTNQWQRGYQTAATAFFSLTWALRETTQERFHLNSNQRLVTLLTEMTVSKHLYRNADQPTTFSNSSHFGFLGWKSMSWRFF